MSEQLRTFYWAPQPSPRWKSLITGKPRRWKAGNAGDLFNVDLVAWKYPGVRPVIVRDHGSKILFVGSIARLVGAGDVVNGIGAKAATMTPAAVDVQIRGLRGPLSLATFKTAGYDVSTVEFLGDPGLAIGRVHPELHEVVPEVGRTIVIPHYRHRNEFGASKIPIVQIDAKPVSIGREIARSEHVYTSSLHGLIWAHALGRPATLIAPPAEEPAFKYEDYLLSIGHSLGSPPTLDEALRIRKPDSPIDVAEVVSSITMPALEELRTMGVVH
jgi:pyruvyltransferase